MHVGRVFWTPSPWKITDPTCFFLTVDPHSKLAQAEKAMQTVAPTPERYELLAWLGVVVAGIAQVGSCAGPVASWLGSVAVGILRHVAVNKSVHQRQGWWKRASSYAADTIAPAAVLFSVDVVLEVGYTSLFLFVFCLLLLLQAALLLAAPGLGVDVNQDAALMGPLHWSVL